LRRIPIPNPGVDPPLRVTKVQDLRSVLNFIKQRAIKGNSLNIIDSNYIFNFINFGQRFQKKFLNTVDNLQKLNSIEKSILKKLLKELENLTCVFRRRGPNKFKKSEKFGKIFRYNSNNKLYVALRAAFNFFKSKNSDKALRINNLILKHLPFSIESSKIVEEFFYLNIRILFKLRMIEKEYNIKYISLSFLGWAHPRQSLCYKLNIYLQLTKPESPYIKVTYHYARIGRLNATYEFQIEVMWYFFSEENAMLDYGVWYLGYEYLYTLVVPKIKTGTFTTKLRSIRIQFDVNDSVLNRALIEMGLSPQKRLTYNINQSERIIGPVLEFYSPETVRYCGFYGKYGILKIRNVDIGNVYFLINSFPEKYRKELELFNRRKIKLLKLV
jgi:hypothetical protein